MQGQKGAQQFTELVLPEGVCECGRQHEPDKAVIVTEPGAIDQLPRLAAQQSVGTPLVVYDQMTVGLVGDQIKAAFDGADKQYETLVLGTAESPFEGNEQSAKQVSEHAKSVHAGVLVGVGAGALNDLGKYVAFELDIPYISVATAPSMDGYMAPISALSVGSVKVTYDTKAPAGVIADLNVLAAAPMSLISAGFADVIGKLTSLRDWEMARVLFDEYWCPLVSEHVEQIAAGLLQAAPQVADRSLDSVRLLTAGLMEAGISVGYVGSSRPTSGSEHLVSHYVEMRSANEGWQAGSHGHVVGFGMLIASEMVQSMLRLTADDVRGSDFSPDVLTDVVAELGFDQVPDNFGKSKFDPAVRNERLQTIADRWDDIKAVLQKVPQPEVIHRALTTVGAPTTYTAIGLNKRLAAKVVSHARYMRERYTMLDLAAEVGVLSKTAPKIIEKYA